MLQVILAAGLLIMLLKDIGAIALSHTVVVLLAAVCFVIAVIGVVVHYRN
jgi:hypothetical protein